MSDNTTLPGTGTVVASDDVGGVQYQRVKLDIGGDGAASPVTASNALPVALDAASLAALETVSANVTGVATEATLAAASAKLPASLGIKTAANSLSVAPASDAVYVVALDAASLAALETVTVTGFPATQPVSGSVTVTGVSTETTLAAASAKLPASLGIKTASASLSVVPASDAVYVVAPLPAATTSISGTITTGGTAQNAAAANATRKGFWIQNLSAGDLWLSTVAAAVASQPSLKLIAGAYYESPFGGAGTGAISIIGATTSQAFSGREW